MTFNPGSAAVPKTKIELSIECKNLENLDFTSLSDPLVVVRHRVSNSGPFVELGRTEQVNNDINPKFAKKFEYEYFFEMVQTIELEIFDIDFKHGSLNDQDYLGKTQMNIGEIVSAGARGLTHKLKAKGKTLKGSITVRAEEIQPARDFFSFKMSLSGLKTSMFGGSKHFLEICRANEDGSFTTVYRSKEQEGKYFSFNLDIGSRQLCNGDLQRTLELRLFKYKDNGHKLIGSKQSSGEDLKQSGRKYNLGYGTLSIDSVKHSQKFTFLDYITAGMQMNFVVAIDFTGSNGEYQDPRSLHHCGQTPSQYYQATQSVGQVIQDYDTDKLYPVFGFGAKIPPSGHVSHMFPCNFNNQNPFVQGIDGILAAYYNCLPQIQFYGPTNFSPVINEVARMAADPGNLEKPVPDYFVLLILTDGIITDMDKTMEAIVNASGLPFSIIIVGVGDADFSAMDALDSDDQALRANGRIASRDIVQFVPFRNFNTSQLLAQHVLAEIPDQVSQFMFQNKKTPPPSY